MVGRAHQEEDETVHWGLQHAITRQIEPEVTKKRIISGLKGPTGETYLFLRLRQMIGSF